MACECCKRYAPHPIEGEQGPCDGDAALTEARKWALIWKKRAREAGWDPGGGVLGGFVKDSIKVVIDETMPPGTARAVSGDSSIDVVNIGPEAKKQEARTIAWLMEAAEEDANLDAAEVLESVLMLLGRPAYDSELRAILEEGDRPKADEPEEAVLTDGLARAIEQGKTEWNGKAITYCAGKRRHGFLEDTPMLEQLLEKGCFHCDERLPADGTIWPYGPSDFHEDVCRLQLHRGRGFCDCKASDASDTEWGMGA